MKSSKTQKQYVIVCCGKCSKLFDCRKGFVLYSSLYTWSNIDWEIYRTVMERSTNTWHRWESRNCASIRFLLYDSWCNFENFSGLVYLLRILTSFARLLDCSAIHTNPILYRSNHIHCLLISYSYHVRTQYDTNKILATLYFHFSDWGWNRYTFCW